MAFLAYSMPCWKISFLAVVAGGMVADPVREPGHPPVDGEGVFFRAQSFLELGQGGLGLGDVGALGVELVALQDQAAGGGRVLNGGEGGESGQAAAGEDEKNKTPMRAFLVDVMGLHLVSGSYSIFEGGDKAA